MCTAAINLTSKALKQVSNAEVLLKIKGFLALFIQTMEVRLWTPHALRVAVSNSDRAGATLSQHLIVSF